MGIKLAVPTEHYAQQVMDYKAQMLANGDSLAGCAGLERCETFAQWVRFAERGRAAYGDGYVPQKVFLGVAEDTDELVGMIDLRLELSEFLLNFGGNIGYSVLPSQRRKGYAKEMLAQVLQIAKQEGLEKVLITCNKTNDGSRRTILANGGVLENEVLDTVGILADEKDGSGTECVEQKGRAAESTAEIAENFEDQAGKKTKVIQRYWISLK
ncbi:GNAT family N-acetyltransferase [Arcanobacterium hippocoleae]|uniref:Acetyltransferase n=1 Tax=Arcanobacterium hippocoleae TaxID=149017 RepID=A0ABU1T2X7_9ACTO|nr:GNAT family N-acetyltransferase [Arcanobacterium hippocoleae]MDR6939673.1 putative acetyltransferase [Arcanobacterium hippocoleae]